MNTDRTEQYYDALRDIPPSGGGGCHVALLRIANFGRLAGIDCAQVSQDLAARIHGTRKVTEREIQGAISKAFDSLARKKAYVSASATSRPPTDGVTLLNSIIKRGAKFTEADLWEASPVRIDWPPDCDAIEVLRRLYLPGDVVFIGSRYEASAELVVPVSEWIARLERGVATPEHIIPNPLTGKHGQTKDGKPSHRADSCVARFRFTVVEFDTMPREQQVQFWAGVPLPVVALVDSGGKSIHGWIRIDAVNPNEWTRRVEDKLFSLLTALGADGACKNEARLSRMPGHFRGEKNQWQRVLYLDPAGGPVRR